MINADQPIPQTPEEYRQHIVFIFLAPFGSVIFAALAIYNQLSLQDTKTAILALCLSIALSSSSAIYYLTNRLKYSATLVFLISTLVLIAFISHNKSDDFGLVWAILYPSLMIMIIGHHWGLRASLVVFFAVFALLYSGLDIWQQGQWNTTGIIRFSLGYLTLTYLSYMLAISNMRSYRRLEKQHKDQLSKHKKIEKIANIDSVTGVYSRHYLNQQIKKLPLKELAKLNSNIVFLSFK